MTVVCLRLLYLPYTHVCNNHGISYLVVVMLKTIIRVVPLKIHANMV